jgi:hypothetical protein
MEVRTQMYRMDNCDNWLAHAVDPHLNLTQVIQVMQVRHEPTEIWSQIRMNSHWGPQGLQGIPGDSKLAPVGKRKHCWHGSHMLPCWENSLTNVILQFFSLFPAYGRPDTVKGDVHPEDQAEDNILQDSRRAK